MSASPRASLTVTTPPVALVPGRSETVTVMVVNQGGQAEEFRLGVRGIEPGWVTFRPPSLSLGPGEQGTIAVLVQPPPTAAPSTVAPVLRLSARSTGMTVAETPLTTAMAGQAVTMNNLATPTIGGAAAAQAGAARSGSPRWLLPLLAVGTLVCLGLLALGGVAYFRSAAPEPTVTVRVVRLTATVPVAARGTANPGTVPTDTTASAITPVATVAGASVPGSAVAGGGASPAPAFSPFSPSPSSAPVQPIASTQPVTPVSTAQPTAPVPTGVPAATRAALQTQATLIGHTDHVRGVTWSPDGIRLATASDDGKVRLYSAAGALQMTLSGHTAGVTSIAWSPDGRTIASGSDDGTVRLWNVDGSLRKVLTGHDGYVTSLSWAPDSSGLASGSWDTRVRLWNADGSPRAVLSGHIRAACRVSPGLRAARRSPRHRGTAPCDCGVPMAGSCAC